MPAHEPTTPRPGQAASLPRRKEIPSRESIHSLLFLELSGSGSRRDLPTAGRDGRRALRSRALSGRQAGQGAEPRRYPRKRRNERSVAHPRPGECPCSNAACRVDRRAFEKASAALPMQMRKTEIQNSVSTGHSSLQDRETAIRNRSRRAADPVPLRTPAYREGRRFSLESQFPNGRKRLSLSTQVVSGYPTHRRFLQPTSRSSRVQETLASPPKAYAPDTLEPSSADGASPTGRCETMDGVTSAGLGKTALRSLRQSRLNDKDRAVSGLSPAPASRSQSAIDAFCWIFGCSTTLQSCISMRLENSPSSKPTIRPCTCTGSPSDVLSALYVSSR